MATGRAQKADMKMERAAAHHREELRLADLHRKHITRQVLQGTTQGLGLLDAPGINPQ